MTESWRAWPDVKEPVESLAFLSVQPQDQGREQHKGPWPSWFWAGGPAAPVPGPVSLWRPTRLPPFPSPRVPGGWPAGGFLAAVRVSSARSRRRRSAGPRWPGDVPGAVGFLLCSLSLVHVACTRRLVVSGWQKFILFFLCVHNCVKVTPHVHLADFRTN